MTGEQRGSEAQVRRLYAIATSKGWTRDGVKQLLAANYKLKSTKDLNPAQYDELCGFLERSLAADVISMQRDKRTMDLFD